MGRRTTAVAKGSGRFSNVKANLGFPPANCAVTGGRGDREPYPAGRAPAQRVQDGNGTKGRARGFKINCRRGNANYLGQGVG